MKPLWIAILAAVVLLSGAAVTGVWWVESRRADAAEQTVAQLTAENAKLSADLDEANVRAKDYQSESAQLRAIHAAANPRLDPAAVASPTPADTKPKGMGGMFAQMFKDPQMRKLLAAQQEGALRGLYGDYLKGANLTPDQTEQFFKLLGERQMALMDSSANALSGSGVDMNAATAATSAADDALKALLGPDQYAQYKDFEKTLGVRMQLNQLGQQLSGEGMPLQDYQSTALIQIMSQENAATPTLGGSNGSPPNFTSMTQADIDQYAQQLDATNQRIYTRAMSVLSGPQLTAFGNYQKTMAAGQVASIKMAQQMLKGSQ